MGICCSSLRTKREKRGPIIVTRPVFFYAASRTVNSTELCDGASAQINNLYHAPRAFDSGYKLVTACWCGERAEERNTKLKAVCERDLISRSAIHEGGRADRRRRGNCEGEDKEGQSNAWARERQESVDEAGLCKVHGAGPRFGLTRICAWPRRRSRRLFSSLSLPVFPDPRSYLFVFCTRCSPFVSRRFPTRPSGLDPFRAQFALTFVSPVA